MLQQVHVQHSQLQPSPGQHCRVEECKSSITALPVHLKRKASGLSAAQAEQTQVSSCLRSLLVQEQCEMHESTSSHALDLEHTSVPAATSAMVLQQPDSHTWSPVCLCTCSMLHICPITAMTTAS